MGDEPLTDRAARERRAHDLALAQGGVVRSEQLHELGIGPRRIRALVGAGVWIRHGRSVLTLPGIGEGLRQRSLIVAHRLAGAGCLTGPSSLAVRGVLSESPWDAIGEQARPWIICPSHVDVPARVIQRREPAGQLVLGVRVAQPRTVMLDLLRFLPEAEARNLAYRASGTSAWAPFMRNLATTADEFRHSPGVSQLRALAALVNTGARSEAELLVHELLHRANIDGWRPNYAVRIRGRKYLLDIAFPEAKVAIEFDGRAFHGDARFSSDRRRHNQLEAAGWRVLHLTWDRLMNEPDAVIREIADALAVAGAAS